MNISIPSGAIKRYEGYVENNLTIEFQFLLVRLREIVAIGMLRGRIRFQFLLVRLRGSSPGNDRGNIEISIPSGAIKSPLWQLF